MEVYMADYKIILSERDIPKQWYNILPDLPKPLDPPINPETKEPLSPDDLSPIFPNSLIEQEITSERWIDIPEDVLKVYLLWRPTPLIRAYNFERAIGTKSRIYYKYEGVSPTGSHKPNTAVAQAYYNKIEGVKRLTTETGAGQWGSALSFATNVFGLKCKVYMVKVSYNQKPYRKTIMNVWGADVVPSPSPDTNFGRKILEEDPDNPGSLGIAISEAIEDAANSNDTKYSLGSVLNHVILHQTIVGLEVEKQLNIVGEKPDVMIGCVGGGSNFAGFIFPFVRRKLDGEDIRFIAVEPKACPTFTKGVYKYDYGDTAKLTPLLKMYTLGHSFIPPSIHAGGLRYHGDAPTLSLLVKEGVVEAVAYQQKEVFDAAIMFAKTEGIVPAPETAHAIKSVLDEAKKADKEGEEKVIVFNFSGHGFFDLSAYESYLYGKMQDSSLSDEDLKASLKDIPEID